MSVSVTGCGKELRIVLEEVFDSAEARYLHHHQILATCSAPSHSKKMYHIKHKAYTSRDSSQGPRTTSLTIGALTISFGLNGALSAPTISPAVALPALLRPYLMLPRMFDIDRESFGW